ncbi:hypothetical protein [Leptospira sp. GIMC2001]|uniref:hypothetical protein n=1 Tax=Leptospira sp. GIMC2001 TaxID=1513297 RepID=UPI002349E2F0|nr:hypothetical protein [Leptospira sp. GIMC2001]WCL50734.1 hypothetical protein O4O04_07960 [Leptospira sp. GIMC2001]
MNEMLKENGKLILNSILDKEGEIMYSSSDALKAGNYFLLGYNPGGEGKVLIKDHLEKSIDRKDNAWFDEGWLKDEKKSFLQIRVISLFEELGIDLREKVCSTNLIFLTSHKAEEIDHGMAGYCWRFHELLLSILRPPVIFCFGNGNEMSTYSFLKEMSYDFKNEDKIMHRISSQKSGESKYEIKYFDGIFLLPDNKKIKSKIISFPHFSRFKIPRSTNNESKMNEGILKELKKIINESMEMK